MEKTQTYIQKLNQIVKNSPTAQQNITIVANILVYVFSFFFLKQYVYHRHYAHNKYRKTVVTRR